MKTYKLKKKKNSLSISRGQGIHKGGGDTSHIKTLDKIMTESIFYADAMLSTFVSFRSDTIFQERNH